MRKISNKTTLILIFLTTYGLLIISNLTCGFYPNDIIKLIELNIVIILGDIMILGAWCDSFRKEVNEFLEIHIKIFKTIKNFLKTILLIK